MILWVWVAGLVAGLEKETSGFDLDVRHGYWLGKEIHKKKKKISRVFLGELGQL